MKDLEEQRVCVKFCFKLGKTRICGDGNFGKIWSARGQHEIGYTERSISKSMQITGIILPACFYVHNSKLKIRGTINKNATRNIG